MKTSLMKDPQLLKMACSIPTLQVVAVLPHGEKAESLLL
jgi:hypothetical protein